VDNNIPRWDLVPYDIVARIAEAMSIIVDAAAQDQYVFDPGKPRGSNLINGTMFLFMEWRNGRRFKDETHYENLAFAAAHLFIAANEDTNDILSEPLIDNKYVRWDMIPIIGLERVSMIFGINGVDLSDEMRRLNLSPATHFSECMSYFKRFVSGDEYDPKTGIKNVYFSIWNIIMMMKCDDQSLSQHVILEDAAGRAPIDVPPSIVRSAKHLSGFTPLAVKPSPVSSPEPAVPAKPKRKVARKPRAPAKKKVAAKGSK